MVLDRVCVSVVSHLQARLLGSLLEDLAARQGAIIPFIRTARLAPIPLWRLNAVREWCINTAAAGGNAPLLSLADDRRNTRPE